MSQMLLLHVCGDTEHNIIIKILVRGIDKSDEGKTLVVLCLYYLEKIHEEKIAMSTVGLRVRSGNLTPRATSSDECKDQDTNMDRACGPDLYQGLEAYR